MTDQTQPMPSDLEDHLDKLMEGGAEPPAAPPEGYVGTNPNETAAEDDEMAVADSDHSQEPGEQQGGGS